MPALLEEVSRWKIDAADETTARYFVRFPHVAKIESGDVSFVIGRKGTGKTAIAEYLDSLNRFNIFSKALSFDGFPFNLLYNQKDDTYTYQSQFTTIWKYIIYSTVCSLMVDNEAIEPSSRRLLAKTLKPSFQQALGKTVASLTGRSLGVSLAGAGFNFGSQKAPSNPLTMPEREQALERFVLEHADSSTYLLLFDALDNDYVELGVKEDLEKYLSLVSSLFKAVSHVRNTAAKHGKNLFPVIFIREDIFELLKSPDKNKWLDRSALLSWTSAELESMIEQRLVLSRQYAYPSAAPTSRGSSDFFDFSGVYYVRGRSAENISYVEYMLRSTSFRPRDIVLYVREAARCALDSGRACVGTRDIRNARRVYSRYYIQELVDEIYPVVTNIREVLLVLSKFPIIFEISALEDALGAMTRETGSFKLPVPDLVKVLYYFNIIGNVDGEGAAYFRYNSLQRNVDYERKILIHKGVRRALTREGVENLIYAKVSQENTGRPL